MYFADFSAILLNNDSVYDDDLDMNLSHSKNVDYIRDISSLDYLDWNYLLYALVYRYKKKYYSDYISRTIFLDHNYGRLIYEKLFTYNAEKQKFRRI